MIAATHLRTGRPAAFELLLRLAAVAVVSGAILGLLPELARAAA